MATELDVRHELWRRGELSWKLDSLQQRIRDQSQETDESLTLSSRQIGKSFEALVEALEFCIRHPGSIVRVLAPTLKQAGEIIEDNLARIIEDAPPGLVRPKKSAYRWQVGRSSLRIGALERQYVDANRGGNAKLIICEEGGFVSSDDYRYAYESVLGPQLMRSKGRIKHVTTPSEDEGHYIHTEILPKCELAGAVWRYTIDDSPSVTPEMRAHAVKLAGGEHTDGWKREYLAQIIRSIETVIIPSFDKARHVVKAALPAHRHWTLVLDAGGSRDLHAAVLLYFDYERAKAVAYRAAKWDQGTNTRQIVRDLKALEESLGLCLWGGDRKTQEPREKIQRWADAPPQLLIDIAQDEKYPISLPPKDDRDAAINMVDVAFARDAMEVDESCAHLIQSLVYGRWNKQRTDFERTKALGHWDSGMALVYAHRVLDRTNPFPHITEIDTDRQVRITRPEKHGGEAQMAAIVSGMSPRVRWKR